MSASPQNQTPDSTSGSRKFAPRRSHNKSRLGCGNCKRRRVKCDEEKPGCGNCKKHRVSCDFTSSSTTNTYNTATDHTLPGPDAYISSGAPTPISDPAESGPRSLQELRVDTLSGSSDQIPLDGSITFADLELLHHFCTSACYTLSESLDGHNFWQITVPQIGFSYRFVLHLVLALSAHHLSRSRPEQRESYVTQAEHHHNIGLQQVTSLLPHADTKNCAAIYIAGVLVCFYNLAGGPRPGEYLAFTEKGVQGEWLVLLRGVRAIITSMGDRFWTIMTPILNGGAPKGQLVAVKRRYRPAYDKPIQELHQFIESLNSMPRNLITLTNLHTLESLLQTFRTVYNSHEYYTHHVFAWMYCLSDDYIVSLQSLEPTALLIFAYYIVLMRELDTFWFLDGWIKHVINGILKVLPETYHLYLQWPLRETGLKSGGTVQE